MSTWTEGYQFFYQWSTVYPPKKNTRHFFNDMGYWLVVSIPLKNISQLGWQFPIYGEKKKGPNHQPGHIPFSIYRFLWRNPHPTRTWPSFLAELASCRAAGEPVECLRWEERWRNCWKPPWKPKTHREEEEDDDDDEEEEDDDDGSFWVCLPRDAWKGNVIRKIGKMTVGKLMMSTMG